MVEDGEEEEQGNKGFEKPDEEFDGENNQEADGGTGSAIMPTELGLRDESDIEGNPIKMMEKEARTKKKFDKQAEVIESSDDEKSESEDAGAKLVRVKLEKAAELGAEASKKKKAHVKKFIDDDDTREIDSTVEETATVSDVIMGVARKAAKEIQSEQKKDDAV